VKVDTVYIDNCVSAHLLAAIACAKESRSAGRSTS